MKGSDLLPTRNASKRRRTDEDHRRDNRRSNTPISGRANAGLPGRKMKVPPADIFVWGLLPETSKEDIVSDLGLQGIIVDENDIEKKSHEMAKRSSYRISVPTAFLDKALDPDVWPLGVKVRKFIHYR